MLNFKNFFELFGLDFVRRTNVTLPFCSSFNFCDSLAAEVAQNALFTL